MNPSKIILTMIAGIAIGIAFFGCAPGEKKMGEAENKILSLSASGVPDSLLSSARVFITQARSSKKIGNSGLSAGNYDSCLAYIAMAEKWMEDTKKNVKPLVDAKRAEIVEQKKGVTGAQLKQADSLLGVVDSLVKKNLLPEAKTAVEELAAFMPVLLADEKKANEIAKQIVGRWVGEQAPKTKGMNAVEKSDYKFNPDGSFNMDESMKGQSAQNLKEDWQFISSGKWEVKGDTILMYIEKEKCTRQNYSRLVEKDGKSKWVDNPGKTYDTLITNHSKDRFMDWGYMKENFTKKK